jgi:hypothetical protein
VGAVPIVARETVIARTRMPYYSVNLAVIHEWIRDLSLGIWRQGKPRGLHLMAPAKILSLGPREALKWSGGDV